MLYYPRQQLADCRSLPTLSNVMSALGIESIYGKSFDKLAVFLKDLGGISNDGTLNYHSLQSLIKTNYLTFVFLDYNSTYFTLMWI